VAKLVESQGWFKKPKTVGYRFHNVESGINEDLNCRDALIYCQNFSDELLNVMVHCGEIVGTVIDIGTLTMDVVSGKNVIGGYKFTPSGSCSSMGDYGFITHGSVVGGEYMYNVVNHIGVAKVVSARDIKQFDFNKYDIVNCTILSSCNFIPYLVGEKQKMSYYIKSGVFSRSQLDIIDIGLRDKLDVRYYAHKELSALDMSLTRSELISLIVKGGGLL